MRWIILLTTLASSGALAAETKKFELSVGQHPTHGIRLEIQMIKGTTAYTATRVVGGQVVDLVALPATKYSQIVRDFEKALPKAKRAKTPKTLACGQPMTLTIQQGAATSTETYCGDFADRATKSSFAKWWKDSTSIFRF